MSVVSLNASPVVCPVCGGSPYVEECGPWNRKNGPAPWAIGCYSIYPIEHFVGMNGIDRADAIRRWNSEVSKIERGDFESAPEFSSR